VPDDRPTDLATIYHALAARGALSAYEAAQRFYEIGSPQGIAETREYLATRAGREERTT
jgi:hypothetical protein